MSNFLVWCRMCGRKTPAKASPDSLLTFTCACGTSVESKGRVGLPCPFEVISGTAKPLPMTADGGGTRNWGASVAIKPSEIALPERCKSCGTVLCTRNALNSGLCPTCDNARHLDAWRSQQQASGTGAATGPVGPTPRTSGPLGLGPRRPGTCVVCGRAAWAHTESADHLFCPEADPVGPFIPRAAADAVQRTEPTSDELDWRKFAEEAARGLERAAGVGQRVSLDGIPLPTLPSATVGNPNCPTIDVPREGDYALFRLGRWEHVDTQFQRERANMLADRCQTLEDEKREILVENAELRRRLERLERKR